MNETTKVHRLNHGVHNEEVSQLLFQHRYWDWVVTTAFYSALHYVHYALFPLEVEQNGQKKTYSHFNDYYAVQATRYGKHRVTAQLVQSSFSRKASASYNALRDASWFARYNEYQTTEQEAKAAINRLQTVKAECEKKASK